MRISTSISSGADRRGNKLWVVAIADTDPGGSDPIAAIPCTSDDQAEVVAQQVEKLISYLVGQPDLGTLGIQGDPQ